MYLLVYQMEKQEIAYGSQNSTLITVKTKSQVPTIFAQHRVESFPCLLQHREMSASSLSSS